MIASFILPVVSALILAGCAGGSDSADEPGATGPPTTTRSAAPTSGTTPSAEGTCPLTLPNRSVPADVRDWPAGDSYGNGKLWTQFWPHNVVIVGPGFIVENGSIRMKWPWWRGVEGELVIEGRRLDAKAPPLAADSSSSGYGTSGFLPSAIFFPTEGCWEVTGSVGRVELTFVTLVLKASTYGLRERG